MRTESQSSGSPKVLPANQANKPKMNTKNLSKYTYL